MTREYVLLGDGNSFSRRWRRLTTFTEECESEDREVHNFEMWTFRDSLYILITRLESIRVP